MSSLVIAVGEINSKGYMGRFVILFYFVFVANFDLVVTIRLHLLNITHLQTLENAWAV